MGSVDQKIDASVSKITRQPFDAAEPADTLFPAHFGGAAGAPGEGIDYPNSIALFSLCGARQT